MDEGVVAHVEFAYAAQESDELTLAVGDVVKNCIQKEDGSFILQLLQSPTFRKSHILRYNRQ